MSGSNLASVQLMGAAFSLILLVSVLFLVRARMIREKYSLVWFVIGLFMLAMSVFKGAVDWFSGLFGIDYAPSAFFAILIVSAYLLLLHMSVSISRMKLQNKTLTQELGLTKLRLEELEKKVSERRD
ncbi:DUF2304 domain-containing protein [Paenibacillus cymbidii]|uniref:DUF2304 domain-containing protein n=1 Tax=Paenibacillus cymbidii TaxID=1639034 RepID=UPI001081B643|nr:DUF2304 domain-containing protein [Paenibacillus cymbidii]